MSEKRLLDGSNNALNQRVNKRLHMIVRILAGVGNGGKHFAPQYKTVHVLPIVNGLVGLFFLKVHRVPQMNSQLSYVDEDMLIGELRVGAVELHQRALHKVYHWQSVYRSKFGVTNKCQVQILVTNEKNFVGLEIIGWYQIINLLCK